MRNHCEGRIAATLLILTAPPFHRLFHFLDSVFWQHSDRVQGRQLTVIFESLLQRFGERAPRCLLPQSINQRRP
jgi:hypothetical protein